METIGIIGISSFSGSSFAQELLKNGYSVVGFARTKTTDRIFFPFEKKVNRESQLEIISANLLTDYKKIADVMRERRIQKIVNFASQSMVAESWLTPEDWYETNITAIVRLVSSLRETLGAGMTKCIQFTTPEVYGSTTGLIKENWNFNPTTPYAISRAASDFHLRALANSFDFPVIFTRAANVYGPHQKLYRIIPKLIMKAKKGEKFELHGGGTSTRSFIHAYDVSSALMRIMVQGNIGETYHISTEEFISINDLARIILAKLGKEFDQTVTIVDDRRGKDNAYLLDSGKIRSELKWKDEINLENGIDSVVDWIVREWSTLKDINPEYEHKR